MNNWFHLYSYKYKFRLMSYKSVVMTLWIKEVENYGGFLLELWFIENYWRLQDWLGSVCGQLPLYLQSYQIFAVEEFFFSMKLHEDNLKRCSSLFAMNQATIPPSPLIYCNDRDLGAAVFPFRAITKSQEIHIMHWECQRISNLFCHGVFLRKCCPHTSGQHRMKQHHT